MWVTWVESVLFGWMIGRKFHLNVSQKAEGLMSDKVGSLKCASCSKWKVYIPKSYSFWVPLEVYIKRKSKIQCFGPVLSSWWFSIHLLELKIQLLWIPPCHTSKVASWLVDCWYEPHLWPYLSKNLLKNCQNLTEMQNTWIFTSFLDFKQNFA